MAMTAVDVPVTISPEAAQLVDELGLRAEFEEIVEQAKRIIPDLIALEVTRFDFIGSGDEPPQVVIDALKKGQGDDCLTDRARDRWVDWLIHREFRGDVYCWLGLSVSYTEHHAG